LKECEFDGCGREAKARKLCSGHYQQWYKGQDLHSLRGDLTSLPAQRDKNEISGYSGWHGTSGGYSNHQCRCDYCVIAWNAYCSGMKSTRRKNLVSGEKRELGEVLHGTVAGYQKGCKCDDCMEAHRKYAKELIRSSRFRNSEAGRKLLDEYHGLCMMCNTRKATVVDHVHGTNLIRGYLCHSCNTGLGKLGDTLEGLQLAVKYLTANPGKEY
jgi:hypothetical protein